MARLPDGFGCLHCGEDVDRPDELCVICQQEEAEWMRQDELDARAKLDAAQRRASV